MELEDVRKLVKLVEESLIEELEISSEGTTIRIQKSRAAAFAGPPVAYAYPPAPGTQAPAAVVAPASPQAGEARPAASAGPPEERARWKEFRSPIVGTFYRAPAPGAEPFVKLGDRVTTGQTLCIIEAMKVMNEIEAEVPGTIKEILVENGSPVEAEAILFLIEPD